MNPITEVIKEFTDIRRRVLMIIREEAEKESEFIVELNRRQLLEGKRGNGDMPNYEPDSKQPSAPGPVTLFDEGLFHESLFAVFDEEGFQAASEDDKAVFLISKFGEDILKLNEENVLRLRERIEPRIIARLS